jgi:lysozyme
VTRRINAAGLALIKEFEGCRLEAYRDAVGIWTIGYGSTGPHVHPNSRMTPQPAEALLLSDLERFERAVDEAAPQATDNQFSAMVALAFNIGISALLRSTVLREHKAGNHEAAARAFSLWNKAGGRVLAGLVRRRAAEADLYRRAA